MNDKVHIKNLDDCPPNNRYYGGNAGVKFGIRIDDEDWIVKYPKNTSDFTNAQRSYTTSPLNEYLGSKIYECFGIPVHETMLGIRDGKLVVACKDFVLAQKDRARLVEFRDLKNSVNADKVLQDGSVSGGSSMHLSDVLEVVSTHPALREVSGAVDRFWDMFLVDALIKNTDRNNTNWGILLPEDGSDFRPQLAPVYDNGNSFFTVRSNEQNKAVLEGGNVSEVFNDFRCRYLNDNGKLISAVKLLASHTYTELDKAAIRFADTLDITSIVNVFDGLPSECEGVEVLPDDTKAFYREMIVFRAKTILDKSRLEQKKSRSLDLPVAAVDL